MKDNIRERVLQSAEYIIAHNSTIREVAVVMKVSKSTTHKDLSVRLPALNPALSSKVAEILRVNKAEAVYRGGESTRRRWKAQEVTYLTKEELRERYNIARKAVPTLSWRVYLTSCLGSNLIAEDMFNELITLIG